MENERKLEVIQQLMDELQDLMSPSADDFGERLGRKKPDIEVMKLQSDEPMEGDEGVAMDGDCDYDDPDAKLKSRLLKLRG